MARSGVQNVARWVKEQHEKQRRTLSTTSTKSTSSTTSTAQEIAANAASVLLAVACALLDRQLKAQSDAFKANGGFTERLYRVRTEHRPKT